MENKIVTFGEIMMRLNPQGFLRFLQATNYDVSFAGGEANVAVSLANFGENVSFVTKVPNHEIGQASINVLRNFGVDVSDITRGGDRLGTYFVEKGASQRASKVIYDRKYSAISLAKTNDFDWDKIFKGASWFHFTGITPALGGDMPSICLEACKNAKEKGIKISCDINYRSKLWSREEANTVMYTLMPYVDVCIGNEADAKDVFNLQAGDSDIEKGELSKDGYIDVAKQLSEKFNINTVAFTLRGSLSASVNTWAAMLYKDNKAYFSPSYTIQIVDRVGGGDSFSGGLVYSLFNNYEEQDAINFAVAASCLKHT
ncbi:MAG: PfkB family carbohydrate kinase, partial [Pleomorphochaeta sp.]